MDMQPPPRITLSLRTALLLVNGVVIIILALSFPILRGRIQSVQSPLPTTPARSPYPSATSNAAAVERAPAVQLSLPTPPPSPEPVGKPEPAGWMVLSMADGGYAHLFAFHPQSLPISRLTNNPWDDIAPSVSPDGSRIAFSSRQNGYWDLLLLDLRDGQLTRLTDTPAYDSSPTWSPDGNWLAFETYRTDNLDVCILAVDHPDEIPICLTQEQSSDHSPAWAPTGRHIAFVSNRSGEPDIWVADLDRVEDRFVNYSRDPAAPQSHPSWSPDGRLLTWASRLNGGEDVYAKPFGNPDQGPDHLGSGGWPRFSPIDETMVTLVAAPISQYLTGYEVQSQALVFPPIELPGQVMGYDWTANPIPPHLLETAQKASTSTTRISTIAQTTSGRTRIVPLKGYDAPPRYLSDAADEAFSALRDHLIRETGWDVFATLENAYLTITDALPPGMENDWLYTGRAVAFNPNPLSQGWMAVVREDFGVQTYWRVYLKTHSQDGSQGSPMYDHPWDLDARLSGSSNVYDQGGILSQAVPSGYWIDMTGLASRYGWKRVAALHNWRTFYQGTHLNELVLSDNMDWQDAMLEIYPPEILITPTPILPPTRTPTRVPAWVRPVQPTPTPTPTLPGGPTPTLHPTWTPPASHSP